MKPVPSLFQQTLERYERPLLRYARSHTANSEDARDIVQDVFIKLHRALPGLDTDRLAPWLFTVCRNRALDHHRKNHRLVAMDTPLLESEADQAPPPDQAAHQSETAQMLHRLISELPDRQREAVRLKFLAGLSYQEISTTMETSVGNVGYLIHHGIAALRKRCGDLQPATA